MTTPFLLDQGVPRSTASELHALGYEAQHVGTLGMAKALDGEILEEARKLGAILVTLDADFHTLLATQRAARPSVIRIRIEGLKGSDVASLLHRVVAIAGTELESGAAVSVTGTAVRIRRLPLV